MNVLSITRYLQILQKGNNRRGIFPGEVPAIHLHGVIFGHLVCFVRSFIVVPERLFNKPLVSVIDVIDK